MQGIHITKSNEKSDESGPEQYLKLLAEHDNVQIMLQTVVPGAVMWLEPAEDPDMLEFFYVLSGSFTLLGDDGPVAELAEGDSFYAMGLEKCVRFSANGLVKLLYVSTRPLFNYLCNFSGDLNELAKQVEEKDKYTRGHGIRVMNYTAKLVERLHLGTKVSTENITLAALFHDVGKCFLPDTLLTKTEALTPEEYRQIMKHPIGSRRLLEPRFGKAVAKIAESHHERADGSGYPYGLKGSDYSIEARIISVADAFDAITSKRTYNKPKPFDEAVEELEREAYKFDKRVLTALRELVNTGELEKDKEIGV